MSGIGPYKLEIFVETPKYVKIDQIFKTKYYIKNINRVAFPGGQFGWIMSWPQLPNYFVQQPLSIPRLDPNESHTIEYEDRSLVADFIVYVRPPGVFTALDGIITEFFERNGTKIIQGKLIHGLRVRSMEERYQFWANILTIATIIVAVFLSFIR